MLVYVMENKNNAAEGIARETEDQDVSECENTEFDKGVIHHKVQGDDGFSDVPERGTWKEMMLLQTCHKVKTTHLYSLEEWLKLLVKLLIFLSFIQILTNSKLK